jgi:hypothetical protein
MRNTMDTTMTNAITSANFAAGTTALRGKVFGAVLAPATARLSS